MKINHKKFNLKIYKNFIAFFRGGDYTDHAKVPRARGAFAKNKPEATNNEKVHTLVTLYRKSLARLIRRKTEGGARRGLSRGGRFVEVCLFSGHNSQNPKGFFMPRTLDFSCPSVL